MVQMDRAQFLRGDWRAGNAPQRPPWSVNEVRFVELCRGVRLCGECISACPEKILKTGRGQFPVVDFDIGGCSFCTKCVDACPSGALDPSGYPPWDLKATINDTCLSEQGVECRSCGEACATSAIKFRHVVGSVAKPVLEPDACTGCGECLSVCPVKAITVHVSGKHNHA